MQHSSLRRVFAEFAPEAADELGESDWIAIGDLVSSGRNFEDGIHQTEGGKEDVVTFSLALLYDFLKLANVIGDLWKKHGPGTPPEKIKIEVFRNLDDVPADVRARMEKIDLVARLRP